MNESRPSSLFRINYRLQRQDHVGRAVALSRGRPFRLLGLAALYYGLLLLLPLWSAGSAEAYVAELQRLLAMPALLGVLPLLLPGLLLLVPASAYAALFSGLAYGRSGLDGTEVTIDVNVGGLATAMAGGVTRYAWSAVTRLIETPDHLFLQVSRRNAVIIPRRAVGEPADYEHLLGFIRARTGLSTRS